MPVQEAVKSRSVDEILLQITENNKKISELNKKLKENLALVVKLNSKMKLKKKKKNENSVKSNGFSKKYSISPELATFLNIDKSSQLTRPEVTTKIADYVKQNELYKENKRFFVPDKKLQSLLTELDKVTKSKKTGKTDAETGYSYFNLQKYINHNFVNDKKA